jgi:choline dehydrogenase-like flavoprotein
MIVDLADYDGSEEIECDLCVAGAGAAGLTIALEYLNRKERVVVLEAGGLEFSERSQEMYAGSIIGRGYFELENCRLRYFGGTTNHWTGWCRPLEATAFERRPWVPHSGWPIGAKDLVPYQDRAHEILVLGPPAYDPASLQPPGALLPLDTDDLANVVWNMSPPVGFNDQYRTAFERSDNVRVVLRANLSGILLSDDLRRTVSFRVADYERREVHVNARQFVLALGGLENPRLLLNSNQQMPTGIGNQHDLVGRFFMEHPHVRSAEVVLVDVEGVRAAYQPFARSASGDMTRLGIAVSEVAQRKHGVLNHVATLYPVLARSTWPGYQALHELRTDVPKGDFSDFRRNLLAVLADFSGALQGLYQGMTGEDKVSHFLVLTQCEAAPNPDSRVTLKDQADALGLRRIALDWRLSPLDKATVATAARLLAENLGRLGLGRLRMPEWLERNDDHWGATLEGGCHHMGTTRMADDPKQGVVDRDCKVHDIGNLYVAGSSVFPTSGSANPTFTIVQLALRLADHLKNAA